MVGHAFLISGTMALGNSSQVSDNATEIWYLIDTGGREWGHEFHPSPEKVLTVMIVIHGRGDTG